MRILFTCGDLVTRILNFKLATASNYSQTALVAWSIICVATYKVGLSIMATAYKCIVRGETDISVT